METIIKWKPITKAKNKKAIIIYYSLALIFTSIGLITKQYIWYVSAVLFILLATFRKHWLMKRLKE